ncbi:transposase [Laribacter hongkongensis]|nr:transposase [Laribacter hongkongensis]MCG9059549.1 transposase [Laribacter hongkongensis]MCG9086587.1 transposase [Laribacter hongkongensis]
MHGKRRSDSGGGGDTHLDKHVGAVISITGKLLGALSVSTDTSGYFQLLAWAKSLGDLRRAGVEGTGTYGSGLVHVLHDHEIEVLEVNRPDRAVRRSRGNPIRPTLKILHVRGPVRGPFAGIEGIYQMAYGERRVMVLIELLSKQVWVRVAPANLRKLG